MIYEFSPKQDLHGWGKPWAPGAGVNKIPFPYYTPDSVISGVEWKTDEYGRITGDGTTTGGVNFFLLYDQSLTAGTYMLSIQGKHLGALLLIYDNTNQTVIKLITASSQSSSVSFTIENDIAAARIYLNQGQANQLVEVNAGVQLELGDEMTSYTPYANVCPIEGYNIWDPNNDEMIQVYSGYVDAEARKLYLHPVYKEYDGEELVGPWMSSLDEYTEEGTPTTGAFVIDFGGDVTEYDITDFMLQTLLDSLGVRRFITSGAMLLNSLMDQAQGRVRSEEELLNRSLPLHVIAIGEDLPINLVIKKPISDVLPGLPGKLIR